MPDAYLQMKAERRARQQARRAKVTGYLKDASAVIAGLVGGAVLLAFLIGVATNALSDAVTTSPAEHAEYAKETGLADARRRLEDVFVAPSTTKFLDETMQVTEGPKKFQGMRNWVVAGQLDSQNRLGVPIRHRWKAIIVRTATDYRTTMVFVDDEVVWITPDLLELKAEEPL